MGTVADKLEYLSDTKELIRQAIIDKGVDVSINDTFRLYATKISQISGGGGEVNGYIPYSDETKIICEAYKDNFDPSSNTWGTGTNPINYIGGTPTVDTNEKAISMPAKSSGIYGYVDLGADNTEYTAYIVLKMVNPTGWARALSCMKTRSGGNGMIIGGTPNLKIDSWNNTTDTGIPTSVGYFVGSIKFKQSGKAMGFIDNVSIPKAPTNSGRYVTIGRTDINPSTTDADPCDVLVKYMAIVNEYEDDIITMANIANLYNKFISKVIPPISGGIPLLSDDEWNALTPSEKQNYNLVAVQYSNTLYKAGILYDGSKYIDCLSNSDTTKILCYANHDNFDPSSTLWGGLSRYDAGSCVVQDYESIRSSYDTLYYNVSNKTKLTVYAVEKGVLNTLSRVLGIIMYEPAGNGKPCFFIETNQGLNTYDNGNGTYVKRYDELVAIAVSLDTTTGTAKFYLNGTLIRTSTLTRPQAIQYIFFNGTAPGAAASSSNYRGIYDVYFIGVVDDAESDSVIIDNQLGQMNFFGIS